MEELKSCPFCGGKAEMFQSVYGFSVACTSKSCGIEPWTPIRHTEAEAIKAWNTRYERTCVPFDSETTLSITNWPALICSECSQLFEAGAKYCSNCGAKVIEC